MTNTWSANVRSITGIETNESVSLATVLVEWNSFNCKSIPLFLIYRIGNIRRKTMSFNRNSNSRRMKFSVEEMRKEILRWWNEIKKLYICTTLHIFFFFFLTTKVQKWIGEINRAIARWTFIAKPRVPLLLFFTCSYEFICHGCGFTLLPRLYPRCLSFTTPAIIIVPLSAWVWLFSQLRQLPTSFSWPLLIWS